MNFDASTFVAFAGLLLTLLVLLGSMVARVIKTESRLISLESEVEEIKDAHETFRENSRTLHEIKGQLELLIKVWVPSHS